jgi:hypothetical protein
MPGETLGVRDYDAVSGVAKDAAQRKDFCGSAATTRRRVRFVRHEHCLRRDLLPRDAAFRFRLRNEVFHYLADVLDIESSAVKRAVRGYRAQHFADGLNAAFPRGFRRLDHDCCGAHSHDHSVTAAIERNRRLFDCIVCRRSAAGQKAGAHPFH